MKKFLFFLMCFLLSSKILALPHEDCAVPGAIFSQPQERELYEISVVSMNSLVKDCFMKAASSSYDSIKDAVSCVGSPIDCAESAVQGIKGMYAVFQNLSEEIGKMWAAISKIRPQEGAELICSLIGAMTPDILVAIFTYGVGSGKLALALSKVSLKLEKILEVLKATVHVPVKWITELADETLEKMTKILKSPMKSNFENDLRKLGCDVR